MLSWGNIYRQRGKRSGGNKTVTASHQKQQPSLMKIVERVYSNWMWFEISAKSLFVKKKLVLVYGFGDKLKIVQILKSKNW